MVVGGIVAVTAYAAVSAAGDAAARMRADPRAAASGLAARATLAGWLRAASPEVEPFSGVRRPGGLAGHDLAELTFGVSDGGRRCPGACRVHLAVAPLPSTRATGLVAVLTPLTAPAAVPDTLVVAAGVVGLRAQYQAALVEGNPWLASWEAVRTLPAVVRVEVTPEPGAERAGTFPPLLALPLTVVIDAALP
jgi:hypothetical protein